MIVLLVLFMFLSVPVAFSLGLAALIYVIFSDLPLMLVIQRMIYGMDNFILLAIPFFMLAGQVMNSGGITDRIFRFANALVGHIRGGLGHVNVVASLIFAGMSGSAQADVAGLGAIEIKAMKDRGYDDDFALAVTASSSMIGPIIPPSIGFVIYGAIAGVSVGALFIGGIIPGFLMAISIMVLIYFISKKRNYPKNERASLKEIYSSFKEAILPLLTPVFIVGGIVLGIVTPTEAAVVAVLYSFFLACFVYREIKLKMIPQILLRTAVVTCIAMFVIATASLAGWLLSREQIPIRLTAWLADFSNNKFIILLLINLIILFLGCLMESVAILVMTIPVFMPICAKFGIDPVHFGVMFLINIGIGMLTPPLGMILFILQGITGLSFGKIVKSLLPFFIPLVFTLLLVTYIQALVITLPNFFISK